MNPHKFQYSSQLLRVISRRSQHGFTLVELIMVIVIMGVIGGMVSVFMKSPIDAYSASARRAALTDVADTVVRRMARDIRKALPNSIRPPASGSPSSCIEFISTKTGGRYRAEVDSTVVGGTPTDSVLAFDAADASFNKLGGNPASPADQHINAGDLVVIYNLGITGSDAYNLDNVARVSVDTGDIASRAIGTATYGVETRITTEAHRYPLESGGNRFHVIPANEQVVSYVCTGIGTTAGEGTGTLFRYARPALIAADGTRTSYAAPLTCSALQTVMNADMAHAAVLAQNVSACSFVYNPISQRNAMVQMSLSLTRSGEPVNLYHEVHVDNTP